MHKIYRYSFSIPSIISILIITSCSSRYQMVKSYRYGSDRKQMIRQDNVSMKIFLYPNDIKEQNFNVTCSFENVTQGKGIKLSGLKISFIDGRTGDTATSSKPVALNRTARKDGIRHTEYISNAALTTKVFDLNEHMLYNFAYLFTAPNFRQPISKIQIHIEANLDDNGKMAMINKTYLFGKKSYLNIAGN